jgi:hypothetical protein
MLELREGSCFPRVLVVVNVVLGLVDVVIAVLAFYQVCSALFDLGFGFLLLHFQIWILHVFFASWMLRKDVKRDWKCVQEWNLIDGVGFAVWVLMV